MKETTDRCYPKKSSNNKSMCLPNMGLPKEKSNSSYAVVECLQTRNRFEIFSTDDTINIPLSEPQ